MAEKKRSRPSRKKASHIGFRLLNFSLKKTLDFSSTSVIIVFVVTIEDIEVWLSLVERYVRDVEVACSNHVTSILRSQTLE